MVFTVDPFRIAWQACGEAQVVEKAVQNDQACRFSLRLLWEAGKSLQQCLNVCSSFS